MSELGDGGAPQAQNLPCGLRCPRATWDPPRGRRCLRAVRDPQLAGALASQLQGGPTAPQLQT